MIKHSMLGGFCCLALIVGCESLQIANVFQSRVDNRKEIEKLLPTDVKLENLTCTGPLWKDHSTVEKELITLNARISHGKLCDASGEEIRFYCLQSSQTLLPPQVSDQVREELQELRNRGASLVVSLSRQTGLCDESFDPA